MQKPEALHPWEVCEVNFILPLVVALALVRFHTRQSVFCSVK